MLLYLRLSCLIMGLMWSNQTCGGGGKHRRGLRELIFHLILRLFSPPLSHYYLLMVLKLQAKVVPLDEVHVGAHQVQQHLARGFLL